MKGFLLVLGLGLCIATGCAQDKVIIDENAVVREVPSFHSIEYAGSIDVYVSNGTQKLAVSAENAADVAYIETKVDNGILKIRLKSEDRVWKSIKGYGKRLKVYVSTDQLRSITSIGSGDVHFYKYRASANVDIKLVGSGGFDGQLSAANMNVHQAGSGNLRLAGSVEKLNVNLAGSGNISLSDLTAADGVVVVNGSGNVMLNVSRSLEATVNGSGNINYKGNGQLVKSRIAGSGRIHKI